MHRYISFLRGVNVGGKALKMSEVVDLYRSLGLEKPRSYIQSGNILYDAGEGLAEGLEAALQQAIKTRLNFDLTVITRTRQQLRRIVEGNPFVARGGIDPKRLYVTLLERRVQAQDPPRDLGTTDEYLFSGTEVYLHCPGGYGKTVYSNAFFEKHLGIKATTRNWNTMNRLLEMAEARDEG
jgi:uncharacterized protein (DUF1697 family)